MFSSKPFYTICYINSMKKIHLHKSYIKYLRRYMFLLLPGKGRNSINECLCPVIKNSAGPREQTSLLCYTIKSSLEYIQC